MSQNTLSCLLSNDWKLIGTKAERVTFTLGEEIIPQGARISHLYMIRQGSASVELATAGSSVVLAVLQEGDVCGEIGFVEKGVASASVMAKDMTVEADAISSDDLVGLLNTYPGFSARFYQSLALILARRLRDTSAALVRATNALQP